jgi:lysophospholipase L1-like esterase
MLPIRLRAGTNMKFHQTLFAMIFIPLLASCAASPSVIPTATHVSTPSQSPSKTFTPTPTLPSTPTSTPINKTLTLVFYGDSVLKVGDASKQGSVGFSIVDVLRTDLTPADQIITSNHGGHKAEWGYENLDENVLVYKPDLVTLWWGMNDLNGCPGIFDLKTDKLLQYELTSLINDNIKYMKLQIEALLKLNTQVIVITPMPVNGTFPWTHFDANNNLVWELDHRCDFNAGLEQLVEAQRRMVADYEAAQKPVYLVDAWQIYKDHPNSDNMYMDIVHPGAYGAEIIAQGWLQIYQSIKSLKR